MAELVRYGATSRRLRAAGLIALGFVSGTVCIIVPVLHLVTSWALPLLGIWLGLRALRIPIKVLEVRGRCPGCGEHLELCGGEPSDPRTCPGCGRALELVLGGGGAGPDAPARR